MWRPANDPDSLSLESTSVERNGVNFNILWIEIWVCCKHDTGHITCDCILNTLGLDQIKWQFGLRWQCVSRPSTNPTYAHQLFPKILCKQGRRDVATSKRSRFFIPWEHLSVERNRFNFNILWIETWVCCKHDTGHITCDCILNTLGLDQIKWQFGLRWQCVSRPSPNPTYAHHSFPKNIVQAREERCGDLQTIPILYPLRAPLSSEIVLISIFCGLKYECVASKILVISHAIAS